MSPHAPVLDEVQTWAQVQREALYCDGGQLQQSEAGWLSWVYHIAALFWKMLFVVVPAPGFGAGWPCFFVSLVFIGLITALVGDLAEMLGCCLGIPNDIT